MALFVRRAHRSAGCSSPRPGFSCSSARARAGGTRSGAGSISCSSYSFLAPRRMHVGASGPSREAMRNAAPRVFRGSLRRWRAQLGAVYAQGYQVASETISSSAEIVHSGELVREAVAALKAERGGGAGAVPTTDDPVVVLAYGLGAWPSGADLRSLEGLLGELGVSHCGSGPLRGPPAHDPAANQNQSSANSREPHSSSAPRHESSRS